MVLGIDAVYVLSTILLTLSILVGSYYVKNVVLIDEYIIV